MSCYKPLLVALDEYYKAATGKYKTKFIKTDSREFHAFSRDPRYKLTYIPCGKCLGCRLDYSREWANRMLLESLSHEYNYFVTLTFKDEMLPPKREGSPYHSLRKSDVQDFMKRLRRYYDYHYPDQDNKIRFYACGEYGELNMRPHYHVILFMDLPIDDLKFFKRSERGDIYYLSDIISQCWTTDVGDRTFLSNGNIIVAPANWTSMAYTARYVTKKLLGQDSDTYEKLNYEREFSLCSRKPGIGRAYYDEFKEQIYGSQEIVVPTMDGAKTFMPPKYFDRICADENPGLMVSIKEERMLRAINKTFHKLELTDLEFLDMLDVELLNFEARTKVLSRNKV